MKATLKVATLAVVLGSGQVFAQATRTWVSGVGDDVNPCSRTAPCKTFAGAISKTAAGGEISVLDPGGFGAVTITKSISIVCEGAEAGILSAGTNGVVINAGANDSIALHGLIIEGAGTGLNGIRFLAGGSLTVEDCVINGVSQRGIDFEPGVGVSNLFVRNTTIRGAAMGAVLIKPTGVGSARALFDRVRMDKSQAGLRAEANSMVVVRDSTAVGNALNGFIAITTGATVDLTIQDSTSAFNGTNGVRSEGAAATVRVSNVLLTQNAVGFSSALSGVIQTFGNNKNLGNTTGGAPTAVVTPQQ